MTIIITGASKGLGYAIAKKFGDDTTQHSFFLCARHGRGLKDTITEPLMMAGHKVAIADCDVSNLKDIRHFVGFILEQTNTIDILINNAGSFLPGGFLTEEDDALEMMMNTNFYGAYHLTKALLPTFIKNKSGHIFNICSTAALEAYPAGASYSISKWALRGFSTNLREELKSHGVKVTTVYPGSFFSDSWKESGINPERIMEAADIAAMIYTAAHLSPQACVEDIVLRPQLGNV